MLLIKKSIRGISSNEAFNKSPHKYYQIKKSCYLKIALLFRLVPSIEENSCLEITQMI